MKVFVGLLACLAVVNANAVPLAAQNQITADEVKETLEKYDPARISDVSMTLLDAVTITLTSASVSGFSDFSFPEWSDDGETVQGTFEIASLAANVDSLSVDVNTGLSVAVPAADASVSGLTVTFSATYTTSPLRLTSLTSLLQVTDVSAEGSAKVNDLSFNFSIGSDVVETINSKMVEVQDRVNSIIMDITNQVLAIVYP